ncbi:hypothetical protein [Spiroplasma endosymbiont of 'Nebria riversi']|uniref:hypothetical protein n=1 Tax=Spiroplasma endosymbiont of 'Nebria riversi' TaxID=2792084 RepID=UPI001C05E97C|nr:hypothetical protein [Spiroplasma endosymbiont of 'Nebria riversi']
MKILNIITLSWLTALTIAGCSKKANELVEQKNKVYDFKIKDLEKVEFWISNTKIVRVQIYKKDNSNLNEKIPELKNLNNFTFLFTQKFQNNQDKQEKIRKLITTHGTKIENEDDKWIINKKITIKAKGT